jgi:hypothetical protein
MSAFNITILLMVLASSATAFSPQSVISSSLTQNYMISPATSSSLSMAKNKGFGKPATKTTKKSNAFDDDDDEEDTSVDVSNPTYSIESNIKNTSTSTNNNYSSIPSAGEEALARLRRQKAEQRNEELLKIRALREQDNLVSNSPDAAVIPEVVAQRMGKRMLPFVGIPLFGGMGAFVGFWYFATYKNVEFQPALVAFSTIAILAVGLLGITYSVMSASWDENEEGSFLGTEQFSKNLESIKDGLKRTRENAILREKMASLPEEEIGAALSSLEKKEKTEATKKMSLKERLDKDLQ